MKKEQSNCWVNPVWWSPKGQDTLNLSWRSGLSRSRRDSCGAVFQKDKRANLGSSLVQWRVGYHGAVVHLPHSTVHIPHSTFHIPLSTGDKTQFAYRAVRISRSNGVFKKRKIGGKPPPWKKVGHGVQAGATTVQSYQNRERNLKSWSTLEFSNRGNGRYRTHFRTAEFSIV